MKRFISIIIIYISTLLFVYSGNIYTFDINDDINSLSWRYTQKAINEAEALDADLIILHLNTYGGEVTYADSIRTEILRCEIPIVAYIDKNAASAGALISIACDRIYMAPGSSIGAATVVNGHDGTAAPDKYQSYMRAKMRATAESHGKDSIGFWVRDPLIAEAMVDPSIAIKGIIDSSKILTFTTDEALLHHYCEGKVESINDILILEGFDPDDSSITEYNPSTIDNIIGIITGTALRSILIMLILGGIYFELQSPGIGFPLITAIIAALLYFAPLYIEGLANYWEILIFVVGIIFIILEIFIIPGFGIFGTLGIILTLLGLGISMLNNDYFDFSNIQIPELNEALITVFLGLIMSITIIIALSARIGHKGMFYRIALKRQQNKDDGYIGVPTEQLSLVGYLGITTTDCKPAGKIEIEGKYYDAVSLHGNFIAKGTKIIVRKYSATQLYVDILDIKS